jgi:hypothetical protein
MYAHIKDGIDCGGLRRSYYSNLIQQILSNKNLFQGENSRQLKYNADSCSAKDYASMAQIIVHLLIKYDQSIYLFDRKYFKYLITGEGEFDEADVCDLKFKQAISAVSIIYDIY